MVRKESKTKRTELPNTAIQVTIKEKLLIQRSESKNKFLSKWDEQSVATKGLR